MNKIIKTTLHPEADKSVDLYPKTNAEQVEGLSQYVIDASQINSILSITAGDSYVAGNETVTPITITMTLSEPIDLLIKSKNGTNGNGISTITAGDSYIEDNETVTPITITMTSSDPIDLLIKSKNGANGVNGTDGNGIVTVHSLRHYTEDNEEITVVEIVTDDGSNPQFEVHAVNSKKLYRHTVSFTCLPATSTINTTFYLVFISDDNNPITTIKDIPDYTPSSWVGSWFGGGATPQVLIGHNKFGSSITYSYKPANSTEFITTSISNGTIIDTVTAL